MGFNRWKIKRANELDVLRQRKKLKKQKKVTVTKPLTFWQKLVKFINIADETAKHEGLK